MEKPSTKRRAKPRKNPMKPKKEPKRKPAPKVAMAECGICGVEQPQKAFYNVRVWSEKLLILLSGLVRAQISEIGAQRLSASMCPFYVCSEHLIDACEELYVMLEVTSPFNIPRARRDLVRKAMTKVESFQTGCECLPIVSNWHFLQIVYNFIVKHQHKTAKIPLPQHVEYGSPGNQPGKFYHEKKPVDPMKDGRNRCKICQEIQDPKSIKHMTLKYEKLLVLCMAMRKEEMELAAAVKLYSIKKMIVCRSHLVEAGEELMEFLGVHTPELIRRTAGQISTRNAVTMANCLMAVENIKISEECFLRKMHDVVVNSCKIQPRGPKITADQYLVEPDEMEVVREEIVEDVGILRNFGYSTSTPEIIVVSHHEAVKENKEDVIVDVETVEGSDNEDIEIDVVNVDEPVEPVDICYSISPPPSLNPAVPLKICHICEKPSETVQDVTQRSEKLCLLLISVHRNDISTETAKKLHEILILQVCHEHFVGSCRDLFAMLRLVHPMGQPADKETLLKVLTLANYIRNLTKELKEQVFINICREFWRKYGGEREVIPKKEQSETFASCRLCGVMRRKSDVRNISVLSEKLIVLVTEVYRRGMSRGLARQYFHQLRELVICQWHLPDVCKELCAMLCVPRPEAFQFPKENLVASVMEVVEMIQKGKHPYATTDGKHFVRQCQRFTSKYWRRKELEEHRVAPLGFIARGQMIE